MDFSTISKAAYANAQEKGFWDEPVDHGQRYMLIISELAEAMEADREGLTGSEAIKTINLHDLDSEIGRKVFEDRVKQTWECEIADVFIRLADYCGGCDIKIDANVAPNASYLLTQAKKMSAQLFIVQNHLWSAYCDRKRRGKFINQFYTDLWYICVYHNIDIEKFVLLKMKYNTSRPKMHGKKY